MFEVAVVHAGMHVQVWLDPIPLSVDQLRGSIDVSPRLIRWTDQASPIRFGDRTHEELRWQRLFKPHPVAIKAAQLFRFDGIAKSGLRAPIVSHRARQERQTPVITARPQSADDLQRTCPEKNASHVDVVGYERPRFVKVDGPNRDLKSVLPGHRVETCAAGVAIALQIKVLKILGVCR